MLLIEATYGNRRHSVAAAREAFAGAITRTLRRGGSVIIPAFAVVRTEVILRTLRELRESSAVVPALGERVMIRPKAKDGGPHSG